MGFGQIHLFEHFCCLSSTKVFSNGGPTTVPDIAEPVICLSFLFSGLKQLPSLYQNMCN